MPHAQAFHVAQMLQEFGHAHRVVSRRGGDQLTAAVRVALLIAAVRGQVGNAHVGHRERVLPPRHLLLCRGVARGRVGDLVTEHVGELVLGVGERQQAPRDEDVTPGQCEGVGLELVDDRELVLEGAEHGVAREALAERLDVSRECGIVHDAHLHRDVSGRVLAHVPIPVVGVEDDRSLALWAGGCPSTGGS
jgi:hypothetical protein